MKRLLLLATCYLVLFAQPVSANNSAGGGEFDQDNDTIVAHAHVETPPGVEPAVARGRGSRPFYWRSEPVPPHFTLKFTETPTPLPPGMLPPPAGPEPADAPGDVLACGVQQGAGVVFGGVYLSEEVRRSTGEVVVTRYQCVPVGGVPVDPSPPAPTFAEIWNAVPLPRPTVNVSPKVTGLTGLETWFWYDQATEVPVTVTLNGWTVTGTARLTKVVWGTGDHATRTVQGTFDAPVSDSTEQAHAAGYLYETKGTYTVSTATEWTGRVHLVGPLGEVGDEPIGTLAFEPTTRAYDVLEAIASLIPVKG